MERFSPLVVAGVLLTAMHCDFLPRSAWAVLPITFYLVSMAERWLAAQEQPESEGLLFHLRRSENCFTVGNVVGVLVFTALVLS